jgi:hypothetical protein
VIRTYVIRTYVTVVGERGDWWESMLGTRTVPVTGSLPSLASLPGFDQPQPVYMLDLDAYGAEERETLAREVGGKFGLPLEEARRELEYGMPILAEGCLVSADVPHFL